VCVYLWPYTNVHSDGVCLWVGTLQHGWKVKATAWSHVWVWVVVQACHSSCPSPHTPMALG
jgi:hypothetical protein